MKKKANELVKIGYELKTISDKIIRAIDSSSIQHVPVLERYIYLYKRKTQQFIYLLRDGEEVLYRNLYTIVRDKYEHKFGFIELKHEPVIIRN